MKIEIFRFKDKDDLYEYKICLKVLSRILIK